MDWLVFIWCDMEKKSEKNELDWRNRRYKGEMIRSFEGDYEKIWPQGMVYGYDI